MTITETTIMPVATVYSTVATLITHEVTTWLKEHVGIVEETILTCPLALNGINRRITTSTTCFSILPAVWGTCGSRCIYRGSTLGSVGGYRGLWYCLGSLII